MPDLGLEDISGVVFDLGDTLLDQKHWILDKLEMSWNAPRNACRRVGRSSPRHCAFSRKAIGPICLTTYAGSWVWMREGDAG